MENCMFSYSRQRSNPLNESPDNGSNVPVNSSIPLLVKFSLDKTAKPKQILLYYWHQNIAINSDVTYNKILHFQPIVQQRVIEQQEMAPLPQGGEDEIYDVLYEFPERKERNTGDGSSDGSRPASISSFYVTDFPAQSDTVGNAQKRSL